MKAAIVHDWLTGMRGGEKVLEALCEVLPQADIFTLLHSPGSVSRVIESRRIRTSFIQRMPGARRFYRSYLPLFPLAIEALDLSGYDLVISSSHCAAKGVIPPPGALHISYIHTPMRYVWDMYREYFGGARGLKAAAIGLFAHYLRLWDSASSSRVDHFIANSAFVARRVEKFYRRGSEVIHPPVDCSAFPVLKSPSRDYYLIVSAFAPYKRLELAISAFDRLGRRLVLTGAGPQSEEKRLKRIAGPNVEFLGWKSQDELASLYGNCRALIFPGEEDFGIVPLEAASSGRPVIAFGKGGALETIIPLSAKGAPPTGVFFSEQTPGALTSAVRLFEENEERFDPASIRAHALRFDREIFKEKVGGFITTRYNEHISGRYA
ncbi:MAG: glycosyltransferase [Deltaproteobacteria bacterium]|nr:glycosyltransferase [Deltaproteobacteria bacterium]